MYTNHKIRQQALDEGVPMFMLNAWYVAAWSDEVDNKPFARRICNEPIVMFRDASGKVAALEDRCCHRGAPLRFGEVIEEGLQCGYHGLVFNGEGRCVMVPGQPNVPGKACVRSFAVEERDGFVWVWMGDAAEADRSKIIDYPFHNDTKHWPSKHTVYHVACNYMLLVDNLMDMTHLGYVHRTSIGGNPKVHTEAKMTTTKTETGLKFVRWMLDCKPPPTYAKAMPFKGNVDRWQEFEYVAPCNVIQWSGATDVNTGAYDQGKREGGFSLRLYHGLTPETETTCHYFWSTANGYRQDDPAATTQLFDEIAAAFSEDKAIVEAQQARLTEFGDRVLVDIVSDAARVHMRRTVDRMIATETRPAP
jgi:phenylpropionate dioxygenase-like ring-hydroxylating dioxygenase large terminal subunit